MAPSLQSVLSSEADTADTVGRIAHIAVPDSPCTVMARLKYRLKPYLRAVEDAFG